MYYIAIVLVYLVSEQRKCMYRGAYFNPLSRISPKNSSKNLQCS